MSEFKYLRVSDTALEGILQVEKPMKAYSQELIAEFDSNDLNYALVHIPKGKTRKGVAHGITREIKRMKLAELKVYVTADNHVAIYKA